MVDKKRFEINKFYLGNPIRLVAAAAIGESINKDLSEFNLALTMFPCERVVSRTQHVSLLLKTRNDRAKINILIGGIICYDPNCV